MAFFFVFAKIINMKTIKRLLLSILIIVIFFFGFIYKINEPDFTFPETFEKKEILVGTGHRPVLETKSSLEPEVKTEPEPAPLTAISQPKPNIINQTIPFVSQAPLADWSNSVFQDACEEASVIIALAWVNGTDLDKHIMTDKILQLADWQKKTYGEYRDTSAQDVINRLFNGYFGYTNALLKEIKSAADIISELEAGNIIISPMNGQALKNPHFTSPGPERHMVVVKGYDYATKEFITNDPGTQYGADYRYKADLFFKAIRDYTTGYHEPFPKISKNIIIIKK